MQAVYTESELEFRFPKHWGIRKYDQQKFYLQISGLGLKGVDFLIVDPIGEGHLYLVEVKNYRTRNHEGGTFIPSLKEPPTLAAVVAAKYEHTLRTIGAIKLYYQRKWWYRLFYQHYLKRRNYQKDPVFWTAVNRLAQNSEQHTLLLWLEADDVSPSYSDALRMTLNYELPTGVAVKVASMAQPYPPGIVVQETKGETLL
jgi:hypothetical protein